LKLDAIAKDEYRGLEDDIQVIDKTISSLELYIAVLEVVNMRKNLLDAVYEEQFLYTTYKEQARNYRHDLSRLVINPIRLDEQPIIGTSGIGMLLAILISVGAKTEVPLVTVFTHGMVYNDLAIAEFDKTLARFEFQTARGIKLLFSPEGYEQLQKAYLLQTLKKNVYVILVQYNQLPLDSILLEEFRKQVSIVTRWYLTIILGRKSKSVLNSQTETLDTYFSWRQTKIKITIQRVL
jgi:hypothetical protein